MEGGGGQRENVNHRSRLSTKSGRLRTETERAGLKEPEREREYRIPPTRTADWINKIVTINCVR